MEKAWEELQELGAMQLESGWAAHPLHCPLVTRRGHHSKGTGWPGGSGLATAPLAPHSVTSSPKTAFSQPLPCPRSNPLTRF